MKKISSVKEWLDYHIKIKSLKAFCPTAILKQVDNATYKEVLKICEEYQNKNILLKCYDIRCPECFSLLEKYKATNTIPNKFDCKFCGSKNIEPIVDIYFEIIKN